MSSSSRNRRRLRLGGVAILALASCWGRVAGAADTYFQPTFTLTGEYDSNREMNPNSKNEKGLGGYSATAESIFGVRTPRSDTELRPRIRYQAFPSRKRLNRTEGGLDFKSSFNTQRSDLNVVGDFFRRDEYNAEFVDVGFDPFNPDTPPPADATRADVSETRTQFDLNPNFIYRWSETMGIGTDLQYQNVKYTADVPLTKLDYDSWNAELFLERRASSRTRLQFGGYVGRFKTKDGSNVTDSTGVTAGVFHDWSSQTQGHLSVVVEQNKVDVRLPTGLTREKSNDFGMEAGMSYRGEVSRLRFTVGRSMVPTGSGVRTTRDELRAQYDRDISQRLEFKTALRAFRQRPLTSGANIGSANRDAATGELSLQWMLTPSWFVSGGYGYTWQKLNTETGTANNHRVFLNFGIRALGSVKAR